MLSFLILLQNLRWMVPTAFMMGVAPGYVTTWAVWRILSFGLPNWLYVKGDDYLFSSYQRQLLFCFETLSGVEVKFYGDLDAVKKLKNGENTIYMSNHQCTVDWVIACAIALRRGSLGRLRFILKDGLRFLPFYGFYLGMHGSLFVKRSGKFDVSKASIQLSKNRREKKPMWLVIFPEGTRINPELPNILAKSQKFSHDQGLETLEYVLHPRSRAMNVAVQQLRDSVVSVYDVTVAYSNTFDYKKKKRKPAPTMQDFLMGKSAQVHVHISRIPIDDVPSDEEELKSWLYKRYQEKDKLLEHFYSFESDKEAKFPGKSLEHSLPLRSVLPFFTFYASSLTAIHLFKESREFYWKSGTAVACAGLVWMAIRH